MVHTIYDERNASSWRSRHIKFNYIACTLNPCYKNEIVHFTEAPTAQKSTRKQQFHVIFLSFPYKDTWLKIADCLAIISGFLFRVMCVIKNSEWNTAQTLVTLVYFSNQLQHYFDDLIAVVKPWNSLSFSSSISSDRSYRSQENLLSRRSLLHCQNYIFSNVQISQEKI